MNDLMSRQEFVARIGAAVDGRQGFAAGKLGGTEQALMLYVDVLSKLQDPRARRAFELTAGHRMLAHGGVFPSHPAFRRQYAERFASDVGKLDAIGLFSNAPDANARIIALHQPPGRAMHFEDQEPDRSSPAQDSACWLPHLRGRRVLLVAPFAELLRERATKMTFERVWAKTGKRWFEPAKVSAIEVPYGFAPETQARYGSSLDVLDVLEARMNATDFDVALIAAGGLGIPLAACAKAQGAVGVSLGGHLQVLFGVLGERWRGRKEWQRLYINPAWIDMPECYRPDAALTGGDYW